MAKKEKAVKAEESAIESEAPQAAKMDVVHLSYHGDNHHILDGVHAIAKGLNTIPKAVWEKCKNAPSILHLIKSGHLVDHSAAQEEEKSAE